MKKVLIFFAFYLLGGIATAQDDSLYLQAGSSVLLSSDGHHPFWLTANQFDALPRNEQFDVLTYIRASNHHHLPSGLEINYGLSLFSQQQFSSLSLQEAYLMAGYGPVKIKAGRFEEVIGDVDQELSSGSFAQSGNARPIPKVGIYTDYIPIPLTDSIAQFKFNYGHGWLGEKRFVKKTFLHEKSVYIRLGRDETTHFYAGFNHFAMWGGKHPNGQLPNRASDYMRIVIGAPQKNDGAFPDIPQNVNNALGNHLGVWDIGFKFAAADWRFRVYTQSIFEKGNGTRTGRDKLEAFRLFTRDRMIGISADLPDNQSLLQSFTLEYMQTMHQGGEVIFEGRDDYYNHPIYNSGWTYDSNVIGNPLFFTLSDAQLYFGGEETRGKTIVNNRFRAVHLGMRGAFTHKISYRLLATAVNNHGNYDNQTFFDWPYRQLHTLLDISYQVLDDWQLSLNLAVDRGELTNNEGVRLTFLFTLP